MPGIVIVGAGQAGATLAAKLRALGYHGSITLIGKEAIPPYQRPSLSKAYLLGEMDVERLYLRALSFWDDQKITLKLGQEVSSIDRQERTLQVGHETIAYDQLVLTTGAQPRHLPISIGGALAGVYTIRTVADVDAMTPEFREGRKLIIIGGGYIGLEAAAVSRKLGLDVTLIEMAPRILNRVASPETSNYFRQLHQEHGVQILENTALIRLTGKEHVSGAVLSDGTTRAADFVIVGVGIVPDITQAQTAGLSIDNGICTDEFGRTSDPYIWAAGDCASFPYGEGRLRLESVGNAIDQSEIVAANMLGAEMPYQAKPWFWSDQYDVKLQIAGLNTGYDHIVTRRSGDNSVSFWYYRADHLLALDAMNDARSYMIGKRLIEAGKSPDPTLIADASVDLKQLLKT